MQPTWPIYVISMPAAAARRAQCAAAMERLGLPFEFFDAVEGARLTEDEIARLYDPEKNARLYKHPLSRPEMGCYLSHLALWRRIAAGEADGAFLLEDDFEATPGLAELLRAISCAGLTNCMVKLFAGRPVRGAEACKLAGGYKLVMPSRVPGQTLGYAIDREAARRLEERALPICRPVDMEIKHWWTFDVPVLVVQPSALDVNLGRTGSSIEPERKQARTRGPLSALRRLTRNLRYQLAYNLGVLCTQPQRHEHLRRLRACLAKASAPGK